MNNIKVTKRDNTLADYDVSKIHKVVSWACEGIKGVSISDVELKAKIEITDKIKTSDIHDLLINSAKSLICESTPNYDKVAGRLLNCKLRKEVYGSIVPDRLYDIIQRNVQSKVYSNELLTLYTEAEWDQIDNFIDHSRDDDFRYAGLLQFMKSYLVTNKKTKEIFETPQIAYALIGAVLFACEDKDKRMSYVKSFYDISSKFFIGLPTPIMAGVRTPVKQFSSCVLIESGDSLPSIEETSKCIVEYASRRAGIGISANNIRSLGSSVKNGYVEHTGVVNFIKYFQASMNAVSQGGIRKGSATTYYLGWHYDFEDLVVLKNNKGTHETRVQEMDHAFLLNSFMLKRYINNQDITLFCPNDVPDLVEAFYSDQEKFAELYINYEKDDTKRKRTISSKALFHLLMQERAETARIYIMFVDNTNIQGPFKQDVRPIKQSNLCVAGDTLVDISWIDKETGKEEFSNCEIQTIFWSHRNAKEDSIKVRSYNINTNLVEYKRVLDFGLTSSEALTYKFKFEYLKNNYHYFITTNELECTADHKIYTKNRGYVEAQNITDSDEFLVYDDGILYTATLKSTEYHNYNEVFDITVEDNHNFFANNVLIHNCTEIALPTEPVGPDGEGLIALCTLASLNWGKFNKPEDMEQACNIVVRALDNLLSYQNYPVKQSEDHTKLFRPLGIGVNNLAYFLAKRGLKYDSEGAKECYKYAQAQYKYLFKASVDLAKERGPCEGYKDLKETLIYENYSESKKAFIKQEIGIDIDNDIDPEWTEIKKRYHEFGVRNSTLTAIMPSESNSLVINATNGIEPPRSVVVQKKKSMFPIVVPESIRLKNKYQFIRDIESPKGYLKVAAALQIFTDQAISTNTSYEPKFYNSSHPNISYLMEDLLTCYSYGLKTLYYYNTNSEREELNIKIETDTDTQEESCDSCTL